jgi:hypothetical protein
VLKNLRVGAVTCAKAIIFEVGTSIYVNIFVAPVLCASISRQPFDISQDSGAI